MLPVEARSKMIHIRRLIDVLKFALLELIAEKGPE